MKFLIIKQTSLGDVLHTTPFIRAIKKAYPNALIDIVVDKSALQIVSANPNINKCFVLNIKKYEKEILSSVSNFFKTGKEFLGVVSSVSKENYDAAFDLQGLERSVFFLYRAKAKKKFAKGRWPFITCYENMNEHAIKRYLHFLSFIGIEEDGYKMDFYLSDSISDKTEKALASQSKSLPKEYVVFTPYSRWASKDCSAKKIKEITLAVKKKTNLPVIIPVTDAMKEETENLLKDDALIVSSIEIDSLAYIISRSTAIISVDSFPMHIGCAFNRPLVALFGGSRESLVGPLTENSVVLRAGCEPKSPWYYREHRDNNLMDGIDTEDIVENLLSVMGR